MDIISGVTAIANQLILFRALDANGYVISGAKAYVYQAGTFTLITIYSDEAGTIPASNPVIADANGFFAQRFVTQAARVAFKLADDTTLYTLDPAPTAVGSGAGASQVSFSPTVNIPQTTVQTAVEAVDTNARAREAVIDAAKQPLDADLTALAAPTYVRGDTITRGVSALGRLALGASGTVLTSDGTDAVWQGQQYMSLADEKTSGTNGGTFTGTAWQTRTLNTSRANTITGASLSSNQITLPAGTYRVMARAPALRVGNNQARLQNITDSTTAIWGTSGVTEQSGAIVQHDSSVWGVVTIAASKVFELQHRSTLTQLTDGFGAPLGQGTEVYAMIDITKVA